MKQEQLRNFIPLSGPATREPVKGDESNFRISLGFTPSWFRQHLGIDFSECWHKDPIYRYETMVKMRRYVHEMFPYLDNFKSHLNEKGIEPSCATISGVYGTCSISSIYGIPVNFREDGWPDSNKHYTKEELMKLKPITVADTPFVRELMEQMDKIEENYGMIDGYLGYQGILNNAFRLMGQEIFVEMLDDPPFAEFLFQHICDTMLQFIKLVQARQNRSGFPVDFLSVSNCVINMLSTDMYEEMLLPFDQKLAKEFEVFGVHTCNWDITRHIGAFQKIGPLGYLDMGMMSDMKKVRESFPDTRLAVLYHPTLMLEKPLDKLRADFERICAEAAPVDLVLADIDVNMPVERVQEVVKMAYEIEQKNHH